MHGQILAYESANNFYLLKNHFPILQATEGNKIVVVKPIYGKNRE